MTYSANETKYNEKTYLGDLLFTFKSFQENELSEENVVTFIDQMPNLPSGQEVSVADDDKLYLKPLTLQHLSRDSKYKYIRTNKNVYDEVVGKLAGDDCDPETADIVLLTRQNADYLEDRQLELDELEAMQSMCPKSFTERGLSVSQILHSERTSEFVTKE